MKNPIWVGHVWGGVRNGVEGRTEEFSSMCKNVFLKVGEGLQVFITTFSIFGA